MKTKLKNIIFLILISGILISCNCKDTYQYVPEENKLIYQQDELVIFKSNLGNSDTFRIDIIKENHDVESGTCGLFSFRDKTDYEEFIVKDYIDIHTGEIAGYFEIKIDNNNSYYKWFNVCCFGYESDYLIGAYIINNNEYKEVYCVKKNGGSSNFKEIYYNKTYGIIKYLLKTGEEWTIQR